MNRTCLTCLFLGLTAVMLLAQSNPVLPVHSTASVADSNSAPHADPKAQARILDSYGKLPLAFEANHGQTDGRVKFLSRTGGYTLFLTGDEAVMALSGKKTSPDKARDALTARTLPAGIAEAKAGGVLRMKLRNANPAAKVTGVDELGGRSNYFIGNDSTKWRTNVPTYAKVKYEGIYSGIDLVYYGNQRQLEYDFIVAPGADPRRIAFGVSGAQRIHQDAQGELVFKVGEDEVRWHKPVAYQEKNGERQLVAARYAIADGNRVGFEVAKYDAGRPLYIDPLIYSTYLGGSGPDAGQGIAVDSAGDAYVTGYTSSSNFPVTPGAFQTGKGSDSDAFVTKINPSGSALVYSTYLGGSGPNAGRGIAVDSAGNAYVTGFTSSPNFPVTPGAFQTTYGGDGNAFVTKINPTGSALVYSSYLGGSGGSGGGDSGSAIALDNSGEAYVTGLTKSTNFPTTPGVFQAVCRSATCYSAFVTEFNATGSALVYSTYLGGNVADEGYGIAVDSAGNAYVTGFTSSPNFPVTPGAFQTVCNGEDRSYPCEDAFVTKLNPTGSALAYSTYLGGSGGRGDGGGNYGVGIAVDSSGSAYVTGWTGSPNFPEVGGFQGYGTKGDAFVTKFNATGSALIYSSYLGGNSSDEGFGIAVDSSGNAYVTGVTDSFDFPVTPGAIQAKCGNRKKCGGNAFVSEVNSTGSGLVYSTYLGGNVVDAGYGIAVDGTGNAYVTGLTYSANFPVSRGALQTAYGGDEDAFVSKIQPVAGPVATVTALGSLPNPSSYGQSVAFTAVVTSALGPPPDGETIAFDQGKAVLGTGTLSGGTASFMTSTLKVGTNAIKAVYAGDSKFAGSTSNVVEQVVEAAGDSATATP